MDFTMAAQMDLPRTKTMDGKAWLGLLLAAWGSVVGVQGSQGPALLRIPAGAGSDGILEATAVSDDGEVVAGVVRRDTEDRAVRWTLVTGVVDLGTLPGTWAAEASDLSGDGTRVVGTSGNGRDGEGYGGDPIPFLWIQGKGTGPLESRSRKEEEPEFSFAEAISGDGRVVVGGSMSAAFRWTRETGFQSLGALTGSQHAVATGTNEDGSLVVGRCRMADGGTLFLWRAGTGMQPILETRESYWGTPVRLSRDGSTVVGEADQRAFRWTEKKGKRDLGVLPGHAFSAARGVSGDGAIVVGTSTRRDHTQNRAFFWTAPSWIRDLDEYLQEIGMDTTGWVLEEAVDISADGTVILGNGTYDGERCAFLLTGLPPLTEASLLLEPHFPTGFSLVALSWMAWYLVWRNRGAKSEKS